MLKILSVHWGLQVGGVGKYAVLIEQAERFADVEVHSLCILNKGRQIDESTVDALQHKTVVWRKSLLDLDWMGQGIELIQSWQPDLIMSHGFNGHFIVSVLRSRAGKSIPVICSYHGEYHAITPMHRLSGVIYNHYTRHYIKHTVLSVVPVAEYCGRFLVEHGVDPAKINVIHNGIENMDNSELGRNELRAEWGIREDEILIGVASRIDPVKGISYLLEAFVEIAGRQPEVRLVIIGTGTLDEQLRAEVNRHGLSGRVVFAGFRTDMERCFATFDIFALPSLAEYHSIGLLEAMRAKKAIVATSVGGNTESVRDGIEALVVPPADSKALAAALDRLLGDDSLRNTLAESAQARFRREFTTEQMLKRTADWFVRCGQSAAAQGKFRSTPV